MIVKKKRPKFLHELKPGIDPIYVIRVDDNGKEISHFKTYEWRIKETVGYRDFWGNPCSFVNLFPFKNDTINLMIWDKEFYFKYYYKDCYLRVYTYDCKKECKKMAR